MTTEREWIEFETGPARVQTDRVFTSLNHKGELGINRHAFNELGCPEAVVLLFDPRNDTIGLKPSGRLMPNAFAVKPKGPRGRWTVRIIPFLRRHDIRIDGTVRFSTAAVEDGVLVLDLRKMEKSTLGPRGTYRRR